MAWARNDDCSRWMRHDGATVDRGISSRPWRASQPNGDEVHGPRGGTLTFSTAKRAMEYTDRHFPAHRNPSQEWLDMARKEGVLE